METLFEQSKNPELDQLRAKWKKQTELRHVIEAKKGAIALCRQFEYEPTLTDETLIADLAIKVVKQVETLRSKINEAKSPEERKGLSNQTIGSCEAEVFYGFMNKVFKISPDAIRDYMTYNPKGLTKLIKELQKIQ